VTRLSGPFVTAVGGTTGIKPETAINFTGGGFSNYFPRPSYQDKDVTAYIKNLNGTYDGLYKCDLCLLAFWEPSLKSELVYRVTVLRTVDSRMLHLVLTGTERSSGARLITLGEPAPTPGVSSTRQICFMHPTDFIHLASDRGRINLAVERLPNPAWPLFVWVPQSIFLFQGCGRFGRHRCTWFFFGVETLGLVFTVHLLVTGWDEPWLWYGLVQRHCWVGSGQYMSHRLSRPDCHADAVAGASSSLVWERWTLGNYSRSCCRGIIRTFHDGGRYHDLHRATCNNCSVKWKMYPFRGALWV